MSDVQWAKAAERVRREWGFELPEALLRFAQFWASLDSTDRRTLGEQLQISPIGITDLLFNPDARPRDGIDIRVHGRYYRDPPEFLTFMHGGSDGLHHGLWFDDGHVCIGVASYYTNDGGEITIDPGGTPMDQVRAALERTWRDLVDYGEADTARGDAVARLREKVMACQTGDRPRVPSDHRLMTLDGVGALVTGDTTRRRHVSDWEFAPYLDDTLPQEELVAMVAEARRRCADGDPAEALTLGRDLHWCSFGRPERERYAAELLTSAYRALGRESLAGITEAHHRHRNLPRVDVLQ